MADILMIGLPDTAAAEQALAGLFDRAGLVVVHTQASPQQLREIAAIILLWGEEAARTPAMVDAIDRAGATGKAMILRLTPRPLPLNLRSPPNFDLSGWRGSTNCSWRLMKSWSAAAAPLALPPRHPRRRSLRRAAPTRRPCRP
jgi:hypothetical protein